MPIPTSSHGPKCSVPDCSYMATDVCFMHEDYYRCLVHHQCPKCKAHRDALDRREADALAAREKYNREHPWKANYSEFVSALLIVFFLFIFLYVLIDPDAFYWADDAISGDGLIIALCLAASCIMYLPIWDQT